jgi:glutathione synthase/RimK-type ligase-like ATP-grasp enzyme
MGFQIPDTIVTNDPARLREFHIRHEGEVVAKPIQTQVVKTSEGNLVVGTRRLSFHAVLAAVSATPCYAQERLIIEAEIRVVVFGAKVFAFRMVPRVQADDLKQLELKDIDHSPYSLDNESQIKICALVQEFGLAFAACDFALVRDRGLVFLEINPNGQWLWLQYMTEVNLEDPFIDFLCQ